MRVTSSVRHVGGREHARVPIGTEARALSDESEQEGEIERERFRTRLYVENECSACGG